MLLDLLQVLLAKQLDVFRSDITAFGSNRVDKALTFKLFIGAFCRNEADLQILCQTAYGRQHFVFRKLLADDLGLNLIVDLIIDRYGAFVVYKYVQTVSPPEALCINCI